MLRGTLVRCAQEARKPMIRFPDRKHAQKDTSEPQPHPAAPEEVQKDFTHFQEVLQSGPHFHPEKLQSSSASSEASSGSSGSGRADVAEDLHDLPRRFWQTPSLLIEEKEIDAINASRSKIC